MCDEPLPSVAYRLDDFVLSFEDAIGKPVGPNVLPDVFDGVEFGCRGRQRDWRDAIGPVEVGCRVPSGPVEKQNGVGTLGDMAGDLIEMQLHGLSVGIWHCNGRAGSSCRIYGAKEIGILIALIGRLAGPLNRPGIAGGSNS